MRTLLMLLSLCVLTGCDEPPETEDAQSNQPQDEQLKVEQLKQPQDVYPQKMPVKTKLIDATLAQCIARLGTPIKVMDSVNFEIAIFDKGTYKVLIVFSKVDGEHTGKAGKVEYKRRDGMFFTQKEIDQILDDNRGNTKWVKQVNPGGTDMVAKDGSMKAYRTVEYAIEAKWYPEFMRKFMMGP